MYPPPVLSACLPVCVHTCALRTLALDTKKPKKGLGVERGAVSLELGDAADADGLVSDEFVCSSDAVGVVLGDSVDII